MRPWNAFTAVEAEVRAMVAGPRWPELPEPARAYQIAARALVTGDGDRWLFAAHARWHLHDPAGGRWHPAPPPRHLPARRAAHAAAALPADLIPGGPDFAAEPGSTQAFVGPDVPDGLCGQIRDLLWANCGKSEPEYPLTAFDEIFAADVPSTVAAIWGTIMWCAYAPAFDGNERLLTAFGEFLRRPLPGDEWVRWLPAPPLAALVHLVAERQRAGHPRAALRLAALIADTAHVLLSDARFRPRALALLTMTEPGLRRPGLDDHLLDDQALLGAWLGRCPPRLARALLRDTDPDAHLAHTVYDLLDALAFTPDPPRAAAAFLADLSDSRGLLPARLDHRLRRAYDELHRAGLTGTSAAEHTQPDGFPIAPPSGPTDRPASPPSGAGRRTGSSPFEGEDRTEPHNTQWDTTGEPPPSRAGGRTGSSPLDRGDRTGAREAGWDAIDGPLAGAAGTHHPEFPPTGGGERAGSAPSGDGGRAGAASGEGGGAFEGSADRGRVAAVLGAAYAVGLAWSGVSGARVPERGFAGAAALVRRLIHERDDNPPLNH